MRYAKKHFQSDLDNVYTTKQNRIDLSRVELAHMGVDTVRQLYKGIPKLDIIEILKEHFEKNKSELITIAGNDWLLSLGGKAGGYRYILKNLDVGYVILFKSMYGKEDQTQTHLKIEVSPSRIAALSPSLLQKELDSLARKFLTETQKAGVAVHIAADLLNQTIPQDFLKNLVTRARRNFDVNGLSTFDFDSKSMTNSNMETVTVGSVSNVQLCFYNKVLEAINSKKIHQWEGVWKENSSYEKGDEVSRVEVRLHHTVINEFGWGFIDKETGETGMNFNSYEKIYPYLNEMFKYGLDCHRYQYSTEYVHPLWSMLEDEISLVKGVYHLKQLKRVKAPKLDARNCNRNIGIWLGNYLKIAAMKQLDKDTVIKHIFDSGFHDELMDYFGIGFYGEDCTVDPIVSEFVTKRLKHHKLNGVVQ